MAKGNRKRRTYRSVALTYRGNNYSATAGDYFMASETTRLKGNLTGIKTLKNGYSKRVIIKRRPTVKDLEKYSDF